MKFKMLEKTKGDGLVTLTNLPAQVLQHFSIAGSNCLETLLPFVSAELSPVSLPCCSCRPLLQWSCTKPSLLVSLTLVQFFFDMAKEGENFYMNT